MISVIFEVWPKKQHKEDYLNAAAMLREELENIEGFIAVERFQSMSDPDKILSLSTFRDEAAVMAWRNSEQHREIQKSGRNSFFSDYRLRVVSTIRDYGMKERAQAPNDSIDVHG